jgi:hypothetical protein
MVLDATISAPALAALLRLPSWQIGQRITDGRLRAWSLDHGHHRIGWRTARAVIRSELDDAAAAQALRELDSVRAGALAIDGRVEPPRLIAPALRPRRRVNVDRAGAERLIREAARDAGRDRLSRTIFDRWSNTRADCPTADEICADLDTRWSALLTELGLQAHTSSDETVSDDKLIALLRQAHSDGAGSLAMSKFDAWCEEHGVLAASSLVKARFGSWNEGKRRAGLGVRRRRTTTLSDDALLDLLRGEVKRDPQLTFASFDDRAQEAGWNVSAGMYVSRFGSWNAAKEFAGGTPRSPGFQPRTYRSDGPKS